MNAPTLAPEISPTDQEAQIVLAFLDEPLLYTGQEGADRGNESRAAFFLDTIEFIEQEVAALDLQLLREEDPDDRQELEKSKSELQSLERDVRQLSTALISIATSAGNTAPAKKQISAHGNRLFSQIREASERGRRRLGLAIADDGPAAAELAERKRRLAHEHEMTSSMVGTADMLLVGLTLIGWLMDDAEAEAGDMKAQLAERMRKLLPGEHLTSQEIDYLSNRRAETIFAQHEAMFADYRSGKLSQQDIYNQLVHHQAVQLLNNAPQQLRAQYLNSIIPLSTFDQQSLEQMNMTLTPQQWQGLGQQGVDATENFQQALTAYAKDLAATESLIAIAQNDITRAVQGEPLNVQALEQLFSSEEIDILREQIATAAENYRKPPSPERIAAAEKSLTTLSQTLEPQRGFGISEMNSFAERVKPY